MKNPIEFLCRLLFHLDLSGPVDDAFRDYARMCGEQPNPDDPYETDAEPAKSRFEESRGIIYIYDIHATISKIEVS
ncbi:hypothetical protein GWC95_09525 [Sediminibacterium roseum]|uniref:Uncharacterized protein n=1 Tax=Sediminibacterium roseum TaxID=1978412 RepID=A0ABW9ZSQ5_9BACT|nr:hypothetical protein [Sediminibacterium roseum]NCI50162.1 hypothetical protein [Sediminibacterium roseum]